MPPPCNIQSRLWSRATPASVSDAAAAHTLRVPSALGRPLCSSLSEASSRPFLPPVNGARLQKDRQLPAQRFSVLLIHLPHEPKTSRQLKAKAHEAEAEWAEGHAGATAWPAPAHAPSPQSALASAAHRPEPQCLPAPDKRGVTPLRQYQVYDLLETRSGNTRPVPTCQKAGPSPPSRGLDKTVVRLITCPQAWASQSSV